MTSPQLAPVELAPVATQRHIVVRGRRVPVVPPNRRDPRLRLSAVVITLHVLGQTLLDFKVSVAQIVVSILVCALLEAGVTFRHSGVLAWPASGMLTGSSIALILRASGTEHGDWWSLHGAHFFVLAGLVSLLTKHLVRPAGRHLFNPSNVGIVWCLLVIGPNHVFPQYLWWGPSRIGVVLAYAVIVAGALWILPAVGMVRMATAFLVPFAALVGAVALVGGEFIAIWHEGPISGAELWTNVVLSPEVLVFVFFMMSDPQTAPRSATGRVVYGAMTAIVAAALLSFQPTEYGVKVAVLASLTVSCSLVPAVERAVGHRRSPAARPDGATVLAAPLARLAAGLRRPAVTAVVLIATIAAVDTAVLAGNEQLVLIERGQAGRRNAQ